MTSHPFAGCIIPMTKNEREPGWLFPAVLLACGLGLLLAFSEASAAMGFQLARRVAFLKVPEALFVITFIAAAETKGRSPWLQICAVAACLGWLLTIASFLID